ADAELLRRRGDVVGDSLEPELRRVDPDDLQSGRAIVLPPGLQMRERPQAVDAGIRPEVDQHDFAPELLDRERFRIEPVSDPREARRGAEVGELALLAVTAPGQSCLDRAALLDSVGQAPGADVRKRA